MVIHMKSFPDQFTFYEVGGMLEMHCTIDSKNVTNIQFVSLEPLPLLLFDILSYCLLK